jgi:hypothetical protein
MMAFNDAIAYALTLPDADRATHYGGPAVKVASNGRARDRAAAKLPVKPRR